MANAIKMRKIITLLLILTSVLTYSQTNTDSIIVKSAYSSRDYYMSGDDYKAFSVLTDAIKMDSLYFELYFLRGYFYLANSSYLNDSSTVKYAINDFSKCIDLKIKGVKNFPDTSMTNWILRLDPHHSGQLDNPFDLQNYCYDILQGLMLMLKSNGADKTKACLKFQSAYDLDKKETIILINKYCK
jgi:hypothetical protein